MSNSQKILKKLDVIEGRLTVIEKSLKKLDAVENRMAYIEKVMKVMTKKTSPATSPVTSSSRTTPTLTKRGKIIISESESSISVTGDTYDLRSFLKGFRARWEPDIKGWEIQRKNISDYTEFKKHLNESCSSVQFKDCKKRQTSSRLSREVSPSGSPSPSVCEIISSDEESD